MVWTPKFLAVSEEALTDNILALIVRDYKLALDWFYWTGPDRLIENLPDFEERDLGQVLGNAAPMIGIAPVKNASTSSDDAAYLKEALRVDLAIGVTDDGPQTVTRRIMRYMRVMEAVLRAGNKDDFFGTVNATKTFGFSIDCEHVYRQDIRTNTSIYYRDATLQLTVEIKEGR